MYNGTSRSEYNLILESNIQGDITEIYTSDGTLLVSYTYGAWGQIHVKYAISDSTLSNLAIDVPFKYRGYYHDQETGFYYLNSRYYDPYMMRFINADGYVSTGQGLNGNNMYAYCNNNPVMYVDPNGDLSLKGAWDMLKHFFTGGGEDLNQGDNSNIVESLRESPTMNGFIVTAVAQYINTGNTTLEAEEGLKFTKEDNIDAWLALRRCSCVATVTELTIKDYKCNTLDERLRGRTIYVVTVEITDTYDFNMGNDTGDGIGSILNNIAFWFQDKGIGVKYDTKITFTKIVDPRI